MLPTKRIIPCLDVLEGRVIKGVKFEKLRYAGEPEELAEKYERQGADEIVLLDISASTDGRKIMLEVIRRTARTLTIPLTVGGGIRCIEDIRDVMLAGADKVAINTSAVENPNLIREASRLFGSQCVVVAIDAKMTARGRWEVYIYGGRVRTGLDAVQWAIQACRMGAGELLVTSIDSDGTCEGYDVELVRAISESVNVPVIASGGAGSPYDIYNVLTVGGADAALAATIFHYGKHPIGKVKQYLAARGVRVRI